MAAKYEVLIRTFIAPWMLEKGSVIEYRGSPGPHLYPLNQEAKDAFDRWYEEEYPELDKDGEPIFYLSEEGQRTQKMWKPHAKFRRVEFTQNPQAEFEFISAPPKRESPSINQQIGGVDLKTPTNDLRPPPDRPRDIAQAELFDNPEDAPVVVSAAAKPKPKELFAQVKGA